MSTIRATYIQHGSSSVPNITLNASGQVLVASGIVSSGTFTFTSGTASTPGIAVSGDSNTGIYSPGADQLAISTNGTGRLFVDANGLVGVGAAAPTGYNTYVKQSGTWGLVLEAASNDSRLLIGDINSEFRFSASYAGTGSYRPLTFYTSDLERMRLDSSGRLGLGTSSPGTTLDVAGASGGIVTLTNTNINVATADVVMGQVNFYTSDTSVGNTGVFAKIDAVSNRLFDGNTACGMHMRFFTGNVGDGANTPVERLRITSGGNVGIGVTGPTKSLEVAAGNTSGNGVLVTGTSSPQFLVTETGGSVSNQLAVDAAAGYIGTTTNHPLVIRTNATERGRWDTSGRFLVGTSSTSANCRAIFQGFQAGNQAIVYLANNGANPSANSELGSLRFSDNTHSSAIGAIIAAETDLAWNSSDYPTRLTFSTTKDGQSSPTEAVRIDSSQNLLVGRTDASSANGSGLWLYNNGGTRGRINTLKTETGTHDSIANYHNGSYVGGLTYSNTATALVTSSDARLKANIQDSVSAIDIVEQVRVVSHDWVNDDSSVRFGFVAQELNTVLPEAVRVGDDGEEVQQTWGVDYARLVPVLTKALQEALGKIKTLETKVAALEAQ